MGKFLHDAIYAAGALVVGRWLLDNEMRRLDRQMRECESVLREVGADPAAPVRAPTQSPSPNQLVGDGARPLKSARRG